MLSAISTAALAFVMAVSWLALLLAELGGFRAWPCLLFGAIAGGAAFRAAAPAGAGPAGRLRLGGLGAACIALATLYFTRHPGELILGGWDPGVYVQTAAHIADTGELLIHAQDLNDLTPDEQAVLTRTTSGIVGPFTGMWMLPDGRLSPQFHHLYPSLMAVAHSLGGVRGALMVNPLLNAGCILAMYALARRFVRTPFALAAAALLALNPAQLWQAKFPTAEMLGQLLLMGGAIFFLDAVSAQDGKPRRLAALLSGIAFGLALLARYDSIIFLAPLAAATIAAWPWIPNRRGALVAAAALTPLLAHHVIHHEIFAPYYQPMSRMVLAAIGALLAAAAACAAALQRGAVRQLAARQAGLLRAILALAVLAWWCFVWVRPQFPGASGLGGPDAGNIHFLVAIFGPLLAVFALALVLWLFSEREVVRALWLYASTAVLLVVATSVFNDHFLMWVSRRFVPVVVPLLVLAAVKLMERVVRGRAHVPVAPSAQRRAVAAALFVAIVAMQLKATRAMAVLRDWPGLVAWTEAVAAKIPDDARVFCDQRGFAAPLRFLHGKKAYELHLAEDDPARGGRLARIMHAAARRGEKILFLSTAAPPPFERAPGPVPDCVQVARFELDSQRLDSSRNGIPRTTRAVGGLFLLYEIRWPP